MNQQILKILIQETNKAMSKNEVPIGCVITRNSEIISKAHNQKISRKDPTAHAEIIAIINKYNLIIILRFLIIILLNVIINDSRSY